MNYQKQATDFLAKHGITLVFTPAGGECPLWCDGRHIHGVKFSCTLSRLNYPDKLDLKFWNSYNDAKNKVAPSAYDLLACITKNDPGDYANFCSDFGYNPGPIARKTYNAVLAEWLKVQRFFTTEELAEMQEIN